MELLTDKVIYHVETQEDYDDLMRRLEELECRWGNNIKPSLLNNWIVNQGDTYILVNEKTMTYGNKNSFLGRFQLMNYGNVLYRRVNKDSKYDKQNSMKVKLKTDQRFIADWYEDCKDFFDEGLYNTLIGFYFHGDEYGSYHDLYSWMEDTDDCIQTLVKMHLFGYEIEQEPLYYVAIPNPNSEAEVKDYHLAKTTDGRVVIQKRNDIEIKKNWKLTESEIKQDFAWAWDFAKEV